MQAAFWDRRAQKYEDGIRKHDCLYERTVASTTALLTDGDVVLDLGCGSGEIALDVAPHVRRVLGIDVSSTMIDMANRKARARKVTNVVFARGDASDRSLDETSISAVLALNVFHLVDDVDRVLKRLHGALTPGGLLVAQTPCLSERGSFVRCLVALAQKLGLAPPIRSLSYVELESLVSAHGFEVLEHAVWDEDSATQRLVARKTHD